jgi:hypothetical protein
MLSMLGETAFVALTRRLRRTTSGWNDDSRVNSSNGGSAGVIVSLSHSPSDRDRERVRAARWDSRRTSFIL